MNAGSKSPPCLSHARAAPQRGMTLIELLIAVAVIAILGAIATASYRAQVVKSRRAAGAACLLEAVQAVERFYTTNLTYVGAPELQCDPEVAPHYTIAVATAAAEPKQFTATATPQGSQRDSDTTCGTLTINQAGEREPTNAECW